MKLIKASFEIIDQKPGLQGIMEQIELAGRTCYKSEPIYELVANKNDFVKISTTAEKFVQRMMDAGHGAMLEHGTVYLNLYTSHPTKYINNKYSKCVCVDNDFWAITTNLRVLFENGWMDDLQYLCEPTKHHKLRITTKFICDRGVSHEFARHRVFSFAQESTRYCNYSKDKFDNELTFIIPSWLNLSEGGYSEDYDSIQNEYDYSIESNKEYNLFLTCLSGISKTYFKLLNSGWKPQQARNVLPNSLKTELVMTGFAEDWKEFFNLRTPNSAHPQARELAIPLEKEFNESNLWTF